MQKLIVWFNGREERERMILIAGAAAVVLALIYFSLAPLYKGINARGARVVRKQADVAWLQSEVGELQSLNMRFPQGGGGETLVVLIDRTAREAGLGASVASETPNGPRGMNVRIEAAPFDSVVSWLGSLQERYSVNIDTVTIDHTSKPGLINASLILTRGGA